MSHKSDPDDISIEEVVTFLKMSDTFIHIPDWYEKERILFYSHGLYALDLISKCQSEEDIYDFLDYCDTCVAHADGQNVDSTCFKIWHDIGCMVLVQLIDDCDAFGTYGWEEYFFDVI